MDPDFVLTAPVIRASHHPVQASELVGQTDQRSFARYFLFAEKSEPTEARRCLVDLKD